MRSRNPNDTESDSEFSAKINPILSDLEHIEIWHDGEGRAPDWDLKRITLTDQLTGKKYEFMFIEKNKFTTIKKGTIYSSVANGKLKLIHSVPYKPGLACIINV